MQIDLQLLHDVYSQTRSSFCPLPCCWWSCAHSVGLFRVYVCSTPGQRPTAVSTIRATPVYRAHLVIAARSKPSPVVHICRLRNPLVFVVYARGIGCELDPEDDLGRVQWAYNEARALLKDNESAFEALRQRLESGEQRLETVYLLSREGQPEFTSIRIRSLHRLSLFSRTRK